MALLTCSDVTFSYEGIPVLTDVNFALEAGSYLCIVGENGSGKSTLIKGLLHLKNPSTGSITTGDGLDNGVTIGPLIDEKAVAKVEEHIADALEKGARVVCGGKAHERGGNFFQPTILVDVPANAKVSKEETFGPLAPLFRFKDEADVIAQANDTEFGLAAYFYARDLSRVFRVGEALEYGIVGINTGIISNEVAPFGGIKASGLGREGSKYGIEDYLEIKYMCIGL